MSFPVWFDRDKVKSELDVWLDDENFYFLYLLTVSDEQELESIIRWLKEKPKEIAITYCNNDSENSEFNIIQNIVDNLDECHFPLFKEKKELIIKDVKSSSSILQLNFFGRNTTQKASIDNNTLLNCKVNELLESLFTDINNCTDFLKSDILIICKFDKGFDIFTEKFKNWFKNIFLSKVSKNKIKLIVVCGQNSRNFQYSFNNNFNELLDLSYDEIIGPARYLGITEDFCEGMLNGREYIEYSNVKFTIEKKICR